MAQPSVMSWLFNAGNHECDSRFYELAIALRFLQMGDKELVQAEKDRFIELANKLELDVQLHSFDELVGIVKFKINEAHKEDNFFSGVLLEGIVGLIQAGCFGESRIIHTIWTLINLAYADANFSSDEDSVINAIVKRFEIKDSIAEELKDCAKTLVCLESKSEWAEATKKPYKEIKALKDEIEKDEALVANMVANIINDGNVA